jgi:hypothetical protein
MNPVWSLSRIDSIERTNLYVAGALCAGSLLFVSLSVTLGVALGSLIVVINFRWLRRLVERAMSKGQRAKKTLYGEYALKLLFFLAIPCGVIYYRRFLLDVDPLAFIVGLSTVFVAICVEGFRGYFKEAR